MAPFCFTLICSEVRASVTFLSQQGLAQEWSSSDLTSLREVSSVEGKPSVSRKVTQLPQIVWLFQVGGSSGGTSEAVGRYTRRKGGKSCEVL